MQSRCGSGHRSGVLRIDGLVSLTIIIEASGFAVDVRWQGGVTKLLGPFNDRPVCLETNNGLSHFAFADHRGHVMLETLDDVDWSQLGSAYENAAGVPDAIRALTSNRPDDSASKAPVARRWNRGSSAARNGSVSSPASMSSPTGPSSVDQ